MTRPQRPAPSHPWSLIPAEDYEGHMGPAGADQLRPLSTEFARALAAVRPASLLVLGVATGNGLEHVNLDVTRRVVGLDVNAQYLALTRERHGRLGARLELCCADAECAELESGAFDLVWAGLFFEHVDAGLLVPRIAGWLAPGGWLVAALQLPAPAGPVTPSRYATVQALAATMHLVPPAELGALLARQGLALRGAGEVALAHGKALHVSHWQRPA